MPSRSGKRTSETVSTPSRSKVLTLLSTSPEEKHKRPRLGEVKEAQDKQAPPAEEPIAEAEEEGEVETHNEEPELQSWEQRLEAALTAWAPENDAAPEDLGSVACNPATVPCGCTERLPLRLLVSALEEAGHSQRGVRALCNVVRWVLLASADKEADLNALLVLLLDRRVALKVVQRHLAEAVSAVFGLKDGAAASVRALPPCDLADAALAARQRQRTLFQPKLLSVAEVAAVVREHPALRAPHAKVGPGLGEGLRKLLGRSVAEVRETRHLVRILQNQAGPTPVTVLRALAHALVLGGAPATKGPTAQQALAESMARMEDAVLRAHAEVGCQSSKFAVGLLANRTAEALASGCGVQCGTQVLPMRAQAHGTIAEALERVGDCALLAEWQLDGERVQLHVKRGGAEVQVFTSEQGELTERAEEVSSLLLGHLEGASDCILEALLMKPPRAKKPKPESAPGNEAAKGSAKPPNGEIKTSSGEAKAPSCEVKTPTSEAKAPSVDGKTPSSEDKAMAVEDDAPEAAPAPSTVVVFDLLALNGKPLTRQPLRERRKQLLALVREDGFLKVVRSTELAAGIPDRAAAVKAELGRALSAYFVCDLEEKASVRCLGLMLKRLDGPEAEYFAGCRSPFWQSICTPHASGPEADALLFNLLSDQEREHLPPASDFHFCVISARRTKTPEGVKDVLNVEAQFKACGVTPTWYVDEASLSGYQGLGLNAIVGGKLIPARNLALEDAASMNKACVEVSDDIGRWDYYAGDSHKQKSLAEANAAAKRAVRYQVSPVAAARFILAKMRAMPERPQLGGVYPLGNMGHAFHTDEFSKKNFILGDFFVVDKSKCRFDTTMSLKEDYDFTCSHLQEHGAVLRCNRMVIQAKHETNSGGACTIRDSAGERERENIRILQAKWPGAILPHNSRPNQVVLRWERLITAEPDAKKAATA